MAYSHWVYLHWLRCHYAFEALSPPPSPTAATGRSRRCPAATSPWVRSPLPSPPFRASVPRASAPQPVPVAPQPDDLPPDPDTEPDRPLDSPALEPLEQAAVNPDRYPLSLPDPNFMPTYYLERRIFL